jgi:hypothetical protein
LHGEDNKCVENLVVKPEGKRYLEGSRFRCLDNIKINIKETVLFKLRISKVMGFCEHGNEHSDCIKCRKFVDYVN